jgi:hypothetical protein
MQWRQGLLDSAYSGSLQQQVREEAYAGEVDVARC